MRIVLCYPVSETDIKLIRETGPEAEVINAGQEGIAAELPHADIFCGHAKVPVPWEEVVANGRLKWIQSSAAGLDHCLNPQVIDSPIIVSSASGLFANQVAEQTMSLMFGLYRQLPTFFRAAESREYVRRPTWDLHDQTFGIVGLGGNGRRIVDFLAPFHSRIIATDWFPFEKPAEVESLWGPDQLDDLLSNSDVVILAVPLTPRTRHLIGAPQLEIMRPESVLINVARGPVVDEAALIQALEQGAIRGAGLDVAEVEPLPTSSPLWNMSNVIITPHVGAQSARRVPDTTRFFCDNLNRFRAGKPLRNQVDKQLGFPVRGNGPH